MNEPSAARILLLVWMLRRFAGLDEVCRVARDNLAGSREACRVERVDFAGSKEVCRVERVNTAGEACRVERDDLAGSRELCRIDRLVVLWWSACVLLLISEACSFSTI